MQQKTCIYSGLNLATVPDLRSCRFYWAGCFPCSASKASPWHLGSKKKVQGHSLCQTLTARHWLFSHKEGCSLWPSRACVHMGYPSSAFCPGLDPGDSVVSPTPFYYRTPKRRKVQRKSGIKDEVVYRTHHACPKPDRHITSLTVQCRQVYCLVEMAPFAPSWSPPHQRGEFDGFPGQTNVATQRSFQAFSTYPTLRRSRRRRTAPSLSDPSLNQRRRQSSAACPERPYSSRTFTNLNNSLNCEIVNPKNDKTNQLISHRPLESSIKTSLKLMNLIAPNLNFQNAKREIDCLMLILQQIKQKNIQYWRFSKKILQM